MKKELLTELIRYLNKVSDTVEVPRELRVKAYGLSIRINSEQSDEASTVKENEQKEKLCRDADNCIAIKSRCCYEYHNHRNKCFKA